MRRSFDRSSDRAGISAGIRSEGGGGGPLFFVSVASKGFSCGVSLLFATLAGRSVSVAAKRLRARVRSGPDRVGAGQWTVVSGEKNGGSKPERGEPFPTGSESSIGAPFGAQGKRARIGLNKHDERMAYLT